MHLVAIERFLVGMTRLSDENLKGDASHRYTTLVGRHASVFNFKTYALTILNIKKDNGNKNQVPIRHRILLWPFWLGSLDYKNLDMSDYYYSTGSNPIGPSTIRVISSGISIPYYII